MKKVLQKTIFSIFLLFAINIQCLADEIIAPIGTKFSIKITNDFSQLNVGDRIQATINPRTLKNKKINWALMSNVPLESCFFGVVQNIETQRTDNGDILYLAQIDIDGFVVNGISYNVAGRLSSIFEVNKNVYENKLTRNYDILLLDNLKVSNKEESSDQNPSQEELDRDKMLGVVSQLGIDLEQLYSPIYNFDEMLNAYVFLKKTKEIVIKENLIDFSELIKFPIIINNYNGKTLNIKTKQDFIKLNKKLIFTKNIKSAIIKKQLFSNSKGFMVGDGEIWFYLSQNKTYKIYGLNL